MLLKKAMSLGIQCHTTLSKKYIFFTFVTCAGHCIKNITFNNEISPYKIYKILQKIDFFIPKSTYEIDINTVPT